MNREIRIRLHNISVEALETIQIQVFKKGMNCRSVIVLPIFHLN